MAVPDAHLDRPLFSLWLGHGDFAKYHAVAAPRTHVSADRCYVLYATLAQAGHVPGEVWECGVYKGGTAALLAAYLRDRHPDKTLRLFDTFAGMPATDPAKDLHAKGDFADTSVAAVAAYVGAVRACDVHPGLIPQSFAGLEASRIAFAHVDLDIYSAVRDCLAFVWPRVSFGGVVVLDDYGFPTCPGARAAVDEFFAHELCKPLCLPTGQALVFKGVV